MASGVRRPRADVRPRHGRAGQTGADRRRGLRSVQQDPGVQAGVGLQGLAHQLVAATAARNQPDQPCARVQSAGQEHIYAAAAAGTVQPIRRQADAQGQQLGKVDTAPAARHRADENREGVHTHQTGRRAGG